MYQLNKKAALLIAVLLLSATNAQLKAQGFYFKEGLGYAMPMPGSTKDQLGNILNGTEVIGQTGNSYNIKNASYSTGLHDEIGFGYMFNKNIGVELNADILLAGKKYDFTEIGVQSNNTTYNVTFTRQSNAYVALMPALVIQTSGNKVIGYMHMGLLLPISTSIERHDIDITTGSVEDEHWQDKNSFSLGFSGGAGMKYNCNKIVSVWLEARLQYLSLSRKESDLTGLTVNGQTYDVSQLNGVKTTYYNKNATTSANAYASYQEAFSQPYSNIGFTAGIAFNFQHHNSVKKSRVRMTSF